MKAKDFRGRSALDHRLLTLKKRRRSISSPQSVRLTLSPLLNLNEEEQRDDSRLILNLFKKELRGEDT